MFKVVVLLGLCHSCFPETHDEFAMVESNSVLHLVVFWQWVWNLNFRSAFIIVNYVAVYKMGIETLYCICKNKSVQITLLICWELPRKTPRDRHRYWKQTSPSQSCKTGWRTEQLIQLLQNPSIFPEDKYTAALQVNSCHSGLWLLHLRDKQEKQQEMN